MGYTHTAEGIARVVSHAKAAEADRLEEIRTRLELDDATTLTAAISPHDDYAYAQQVYVHVYPYLRARHRILVGVAHKARDFPECEGKLVFDSYDAWHGPYGDVKIARLREALLEGLPGDDVHAYRITWCGRFSIPFGLAALAGLHSRMGLGAPVGRSCVTPPPSIRAGAIRA